MQTTLRHLLMTAGAALLATSAGCDLYFGHHENPPCADFVGDRKSDLAPAQSYRNPQNGACQYFGGGGGNNPCFDDQGAVDIAALPDWGSCYSLCEGLGESACMNQTGCYAAYVEQPGPADGPSGQRNFYQCWDVAPSGPLPGGASCSNLDAHGCSQHDDCSAVYSNGRQAPNAGMQFERCQPERLVGQGCYSDNECGPGFGCTANRDCERPPGCDANGSCPAVCYGHCEPLAVECKPDSCRPGEVCVMACPDAPGAKFDGACSIQCIPDQQSCHTVDCAPGYHCEDTCRECPPTADCAGLYLCETTCQPDVVTSCDQVACEIGSHCELSCTRGPQPVHPSQPAIMDTCVATCVLDQPRDCASTTCPVGSHCEQRCFNAPGGPATCDVQCVPDPIVDPGSCAGPINCLTGEPSCPSGTVAGIANGCWTGFCIPSNECGPRDPGTCNDAVICALPPPQCPVDTVAGVRNGCWSGYCIPVSACAPVACESLTNEASCSNRPDCTPMYTGDHCTCTPDRCECESTTFARCETALLPLRN
jgi:hypothetical protein